MGVEPTTCRLRIGCSTTELPRPLIINDLFPCWTTFRETFIKLSLDALGFRAAVPNFHTKGPHRLRAITASDTFSLFLKHTTKSGRAPDERKLAK